MSFQIRSFVITPGDVVWLPFGYCLRSITPAADGAVAHIEVPFGSESQPHSVLQLASGDDVPDGAVYLGTLPPKPLPRLHFPMPPAAFARRVSPRHLYLSVVRA